ncbi:MAG: aminotransferase class I/II-fold pyridoxal phosphate-dependent enzyme [Oscillospiraceae bacterium]|jgi:histidinol-phosphate aminotransferase|nr:aminotransferase class I/II-fold pyridoxal phosphate-dependent enzyme [Oscillospiraceae bacterium]
MYQLPEKLKNFTPYEPLVGDYKIRLDVNESFVEVDEEKIIEAVRGVSLNRYPDPYATDTVNAFSRLFGVNPALVTAGSGLDELIGLIAASLLEKGDKLLCLTPDFSMYAFYSRLYELEVAELPKSEDMTVDIRAVIDYINKNNVKALMFSNPCNPTSLGIEKAEIRRLITSTGALVVLDEAYMDFWDESESMLSEATDYSNLIVLRTCSKSCSLAGIRLGFAVAGEKITHALRTMKSPFNVGVLTQAIGAAALSDAEGYKRSVQAVKKSTLCLYNALTELNMFGRIFETRTNFIFIKTERAREIYEELLRKSIAVRCFGGYLRISAGTEEENSALICALSEIKRK